jgi:hypothetical protein
MVVDFKRKEGETKLEAARTFCLARLARFRG